MLELFRRYQRYIYFVITFVIVISFSFFGTFSAIPSNQTHNVTVFKALDGRNVNRNEVEELATFISSDNYDKVLMHGMWGPNFLNDGVVRTDILENGIGSLLVEKFGQQLGNELQTKLSREKSYQPYRHPEVPFVSASTIWSYYLPSINSNLLQLQQQQDAISKDAFQTRVNLYLAESNFPADALRYMLHGQQQQYKWLQQDPMLMQTDLALFGYHSLSDWFGSKFLRMAAQFIINSAAQAEQMGYKVSNTEVLADLINNSNESYSKLKNHPNLGVTNQDEYFRLQLQRMGLDQNRAIALWRQVMLFRRLYQDQGAIALVDRVPFEQFENYARDSVEGNQYQLPKALQLGDFRRMQQLETYLAAVAKPQSNPLQLPTEFFDAETVAAKFPELVQKEYTIEVATVDKDTLTGRVSMQQMWDWQTADANWQQLETVFPPLAVSEAYTAEARQAVLDTLEPLAHSRINKIAREAIVEANPTWIDEALASAPVEQRTIGLTLRGPQQTFQGIEDSAQLVELFDTSLTGGDRALIAQKTLSRFSGNDKIYYNIKVIASQDADVLTFASALAHGALDNIPNNNYSSLIAAIQAEAVSEGAIASDAPTLTDDQAASLRLLQHVKNTQQHVQTGDDANWIRSNADDTLASLEQQWQMEQHPFIESRAEATSNIDRTLAFAMQPNEWSNINTPANGDLSFFHLEKRGPVGTEEAIRQRTNTAHQFLSREAQRVLASESIDNMAKKGAIDLAYIERSTETPEILEPEASESETQ